MNENSLYPEQRDTRQSDLDAVARAVQRIEARERSWLFWIWRGILVGIGSTVGVVVILYGSLYVAQKLTGVPLLGRIAERVTPFLEQSVSDRIQEVEQVFDNEHENQTAPVTQRVTDTAGLYSLELPLTWTVTIKEGARETQRSRLEAESPEFRTRVGTSTPSQIEAVYYDAGAKLTAITTKSSTAISATDELEIIDERQITVAGESATYRSYRDEHIASGRLIDASFTHDGNRYILTMAYNPDKFPEGPTIFQQILDSLTF